MITYSIIIPHKDIPDLLQRCLDSIPVRDDVEVIVVDDDSDPDKVDFQRFPKWGGRRYECHFTKEGKGAGHARNVGLDCAKGRWVIFADADDFFSDEFNSLLDEMADAKEELVFCDFINVMSSDITKQVEERTFYRNYVGAYLAGNKSEYNLRVMFASPWCKLVKKVLIERHHIRFSEVMQGNDVWFSAQVGHFATSLAVSERIGYVVTSRKGSVASEMLATAKDFRVRTEEVLKCDKLLEPKYGAFARSNPWLRFVSRKVGSRKLAWFCIANVFHPQVFFRAFTFLVKKT